MNDNQLEQIIKELTPRQQEKIMEILGNTNQKVYKGSKTKYVIISVFKLKNNPHKTRWGFVKERAKKALEREFKEDLVI
jgi:hypothetical protein